MWTTEGCLKFLEALRQAILTPALIGGDSVKLVVFTDTFTPSTTLAWAAMSAKEATFTGYARQNAAALFDNPPAVVSLEAKVTADAATFTKTIGTPDATAYGSGLILCDAGGAVLKLLLTTPLPAPVPLTDASPSVIITPYTFGVGV